MEKLKIAEDNKGRDELPHRRFKPDEQPPQAS